MPSLSKNLSEILYFGDHPEEQDLDLGSLTASVIKVCGTRAEMAHPFLRSITGSIKLRTLGIHLLQIIKTDSAVRDIETTGHLAKFLARMEAFRRTSDYRIIGLPHTVFDELSQSERAVHFRGGASHDIDGDLLDSPVVRTMLNEEARILKDLGL